MKNRPRPNNTVFHDYKFRASRKKVPFALTREDVHEIIFQDCYYCGEKPANLRRCNRRKKAFAYNGIDRISGREGYVIGNVVPCCRKCNYAKWNFSTDDFLDHIRKINRFQKRKRRKKIN